VSRTNVHASAEHRPQGAGSRVVQDLIAIPSPRFEEREITMQTTDRPIGSVFEQRTPSERLGRSLALPEC
jgi:hypothetical protein